MTVVEARVEVDVDPATAFAVSQTTGAMRLRWDRLVDERCFLDGAVAPGKGVRTRTRHSNRLLSMVGRYVSYRPPTTAGVTMVEGPWFLASFAGGWRFMPTPDDASRTRVQWRYSFRCRPEILAPVMERIVARLLQRDIDRRIAGFVRGCADPVVLDAVRND